MSGDSPHRWTVQNRDPRLTYDTAPQQTAPDGSDVNAGYTDQEASHIMATGRLPAPQQTAPDRGGEHG